MEPGVPFALLGAVQLLAMAGWVGLAIAAVARRGRRAPGLALPVLLAGIVLLVVADGRTALGFDTAVSDDIGYLRGSGLLVLGAGLWLGALQPAPRRLDLTFEHLSVTALPGVVVPLGSGTAPAVLGGVAGLLAGAAAVRSRRDAVGVLLGLGLVLAGAAALLAQTADGDHGALAVLAVRGVSALLLLGALSLLARGSLLSKVVGAILGGVLVMAVAAVGVVGTVVVSSYDQQDRDLVEDTVLQRQQEIGAFVAGRDTVSTLLALPDGCGLEAPGELRPENQCNQAFGALKAEGFLVRVPRAGQIRVLAPTNTLLGSPGPELTATELLGLGAIPEVRDLQDATCSPGLLGSGPRTGKARLSGPTPALIAFVAQADRCAADGTVPSVLVYGSRLDDAYLSKFVGSEDFTVSILVDGELAASSGTESEKEGVVAAAERAGSVGDDIRLVAADGLLPTYGFVDLKASGEAPAVLVVARSSKEARDAQQQALQALVGTALAATLVVGALALLLGRRTVDPVRRLTVAAERVAAGDLSVRTGIRSHDEVGSLSGAFDSMTSSLEAVNDDLRASADRLRTILTSVSEGLLATDADGRVTSMNPAALAMAGLAEEWQAVGIPLAEACVVRVPGGGPLALAAPLLGVDAEVVRADGTTTPVRVEVAPLAGVEGGVVVVLRDTAREREFERMKTEFLSNVSHELRTPLTPIRGYADLLAHRQGLTPAQVATFAGTILSESLKMNRVVDLLVDVAAIEAGRVHTAPRSVSVASIVDDRLAHWRTKVPDRAADLRRRVARGLPPVLVDPAWIGKALDELVDNALRHTPAGTQVTLAATAGPDGQVRVSVADRGPGIAEADQATLFTSFEQVDGSATRRVGGLGLGLSFVSRLAENGGYALSVVSAAGKGAEFSLDLPASSEAPAPRARAAASRAAGSRAGRRPAREPGPGR